MAANAPGGTGAFAHEYSQRRFGGSVRPVTRTITVQQSSTKILDNDPRRIGWSLINRSGFDVSLDYVQPPSPSTAILLAANGGTLTSVVDEDGETTAWELFGVCSASTPQIFVMEFIVS